MSFMDKNSCLRRVVPLFFLALGACAAPASAPVANPSSPPPGVDARDWSRFADRTLLFYDPQHGNQIEYYAPDGHAFLWYPGNGIALRGVWRISEGRLCGLYGENTYNPVTMEQGGWECTDLVDQERYIFDSMAGDIFDLATERVPFRLPAHPRFRSLSEVKSPP